MAAGQIGRRRFLALAAGTGAAALLGGELLRRQWASAALTPGDGPYGALGAADANGLRLPAGFTSRVIATTGQQVAGTGYTWHVAPDGGACFSRPSGGWVYVSNSEVGAAGGGVSAVQFAANGSIVSAYRILTGTTLNCAGGPTPWGTWLSCEEYNSGHVWECNPGQAGQGTQRLALGTFKHEAAAVDANTGYVYLTEDDPAGRLYRFRPNTAGNLSAGSLDACRVQNGNVTWIASSASQPDRQATTTAFNGGEGAWIHGGHLYFTTKGDNTVWDLTLADDTLEVLYSSASTPGAALSGVDNVTAHAATGDLYVCEDGGNLEICVIGPVDGVPQVAPFLRLDGHSGSELTGVAFNPAGTRMYFSSQRGTDGSTGVTFEITGPFRTSTTPPPPTTPPTSGPTTTAAGTQPGSRPAPPAQVHGTVPRPRTAPQPRP